MVASVPWWGLMRGREGLRKTCTANFFLSGGLSPYQSGLKRSSCIAQISYISGGRVRVGVRWEGLGYPAIFI